MLELQFNFDIQLLEVLDLADRRSQQLRLPCITTYTFLEALVESEDEYLESFMMENNIGIEKQLNSIINICGEHIKEENAVGYELSVYLDDNSTTNIKFSKNLLNVLQGSIQISTLHKHPYISSLEMLMAMVKLKTKTFIEFIEDLGLSEEAAQEVFGYESSTEDIEEVDIIPDTLQGCLTNISKTIDENSTCRILGREKEVLALEKILLKATKRNGVLVGEPGIGKSAIMEKLAWKIKTGNCPDKLKDMIIISLDVNGIVSGTMLRGQAEERFKNLNEFLANNQNVILFIDEIHLLLGAGTTADSSLDLANALKPILARSQTRVVGATTLNEYYTYFCKDGALKRRFEKIIVKEPTSEQVFPMIKNQIKHLEEVHNVKISKEMVDFIILNASCFNYETKNPDRTLDLIDRSMATANLERKDEVTQELVLSNFNLKIEEFENMPIDKKASTAYHEAGHYIVWKYSKELLDRKVLAVSIMPAEGYLGVNVFEEDESFISSGHKEFYIQEIAMLLAGRIAEKKYSKAISSGASNDLQHATKIAQNLVTKYGMSETFGEDRVYIDEGVNSMYNEEIISRINCEIDKILKEAHEYAKNCIENHLEELKLLVEKLLEKGILSSYDLENLNNN